MKIVTLLLALLLAISGGFAQNNECEVRGMYSDFSNAYSSYSDKNGYYSIPNVAKGKYMAIYPCVLL